MNNQQELENVLLNDLQMEMNNSTNSQSLENQSEIINSSKLDLESLKLIFNESVLSKITLADINLPLSELLLKLNPKPIDIQAPYSLSDEDGKHILSLTFTLNTQEVLEAGTKLQPSVNGIIMAVKSIGVDLWQFTYKTEIDSEQNIKVKQNLLSEYYIITGEKEKQVFDDQTQNSEMYRLEDALPVSAFMQDKRYLIKVPIAKKGIYHHPVYEVLDFSDEILTTIESNIKRDVVGYPIPITLGHLQDGGEKQGELVRVYREGDILFGEWEVNKETYRKVEDGVITFSSAEFFPNYINKLTGEPVGRTLFGMALTNVPYMPNQPRVLTLSDNSEEIYCFSSKLNLTELHYNNREVLSNNNNIVDKSLTKEEVIMTDESKKETRELDNNNPIQLSDQVQILQQKLSEYDIKLSEMEKSYQEKLTEYHSKNEELSIKVQKYEDRIKEEELNAKLAYLKELNLPSDINEKYSELIKNGSLGDSEEVVLTSLAKLAQNTHIELLTQHGYANKTAQMNDELFEDPYAKVIEYNKKLAEAKKMQTYASLA
jgi:hypothetical protein